MPFFSAGASATYAFVRATHEMLDICWAICGDFDIHPQRLTSPCRESAKKSGCFEGASPSRLMKKERKSVFITKEMDGKV